MVSLTSGQVHVELFDLCVLKFAPCARILYLGLSKIGLCFHAVIRRPSWSCLAVSAQMQRPDDVSGVSCHAEVDAS